MDEPVLDPQEVDALREAMGQSNKSSKRPMASLDPTPIALIADDRAAEQARPVGLQIANRWAQKARARLSRQLDETVEIHVSGAEILPGVAVRDDIAGSWMSYVSVPGRPGVGVVSCSGPMIEGLVARFLGAKPDSDTDKPPSPTALNLFAPLGEAWVSALADGWRDEQDCEVLPTHDAQRIAAWRKRVGDISPVAVLTLEMTAPITGTIRLVTQPETLVIPPEPLEAVPASPTDIEDALGQVPVEIRVELGRATLSMGAFKELRPGTVLPLGSFIDDLLPIRCAGRVKAHGRALVVRGVLAVEVGQKSSRSKSS